MTIGDWFGSLFRFRAAPARKRPRLLGPVECLESRLAPAGQLDTTFGTGGKTTTDIGSSTDNINAIAVDSSNRIIAVGSTFNGTDDDFVVARYTAAGVLDPTFGSGGKVITNFASSNDEANGVAVDANGNIVVVGFAVVAGFPDVAVARYTSAGVLDTTFNSTGKVTTVLGTGDQEAKAVKIDAQGRIVVAGYSRDLAATASSFAVVRYLSTGALDTTFNATGKVTTAFGAGIDAATALAIDSNNNIVVVGFTTNSTEDFAIARYTSAGALDTTFNTTGKATLAFGLADDTASSVAIDSSNRIVVGGRTGTASTFDFALARYTTTGTLDPSFGTGGKTTTSFSAASDFGSGIAIDNTGKILFAGSATVGGNFDFALARYTSGGVLDSSFGTGGEVTTAIGPADDIASSVALDSAGHVIVAGQAQIGSGGANADFALVRYVNDSPPVISSNGGGNAATVTVPEFSTTVTTVAATDPDAGTTFAYSILGGADSARFTINPTTGALAFMSAPNFAAPTDANGDDQYDVTVQVSDSLLVDTQILHVLVTDVPSLDTTMFVDPSWAALANGTFIADADPGTADNQPGNVGGNAFGTIGAALAAIGSSGTVVVNAGTYAESPNLTGTRTLRLNGNVTVNSIDSAAGTTINLQAATLTTGDNTGNNTLAGVVQGTGGGLTKVGTDTLTLAGANTYTGATTVSAGTFLVTGSIGASSAVSVGASGTLGGSGTIAGAVTSSGTIAPGVSTPGALSTGNLTFSAGTLSLDIAGSSSFDSVSTSTVQISGTALVLNVGAVSAGNTFTIVSVTGAGSSRIGTFTNLPNSGSTLTIGNRVFTINYSGGSGNDIVLTVSNAGPSLVGSPILNGNSPYVNSPNFANQHSMVESVVYSFSQAVDLSTILGAVSLVPTGSTTFTPTRVLTALDGTKTRWSVTFTGSGVSTATGSLGDGTYRLVLNAQGISSTLDFFRLLGDLDGNRTVDFSDFQSFNTSFNRLTTDPLYVGAADFDGSGTVEFSDFQIFNTNFNRSI